MYARVVRFTDVDPDRIEALLSRIDESDGPPPGVPATGINILHDAGQGTAVVIQMFDSVEDMEAGAAVLAAMDAGETPGTRASVDACEIKREVSLSTG